ncbi:MAG: hypothetical protein P9F19_18335 [Candidatus Contendobacter sp.]|nr:hypothetical protein [Candidatus Contendobacter sp.]MDG4559326.1 hypothetical protein [Candidatus Contendobacter sp.]
MRETGGFGQPLHALYPQIRAVLASELGPEAATLLAEPVVDRVNDRIDWYTEGDPDHPPTALNDLLDDQRQALLAQVRDLLERGRELAERYAASKEARRAQLGAMLRVALRTPAEPELFLVEGRPVLIRWGFTPDRPWEALAEPARSPAIPPSGPQAIESPRDVAVPEIAMPELATPPAPVVENESSSESGRQPEAPSVVPASEPVSTQPLSEAPPPIPAPEPIPAEPLLETPPPLAPQPASSRIAPESPPESPPESRPTAATLDASTESKSAPGTQWRYMVVGSRYFWSVFVLAVLLAVIAAFWWGVGRPASSSGLGQGSKPVLDADLERALAQTQRTEAELRTRLEGLLTQLAGRRGQCPLPGTGVGAAVPAVPESDRAGTVPARSMDAGGEVPRGPASTAPVGDHAAIPTVGAPTADRAAMAAPVGDRAAIPTVDAPTADRAAIAPGMASPPLRPDRAPPLVIAPLPTSGGGSPDTAGPPSARPESPALAETKSPARTLEEALGARAPVAVAPTRQSPRSQDELPTRTEPPVRKAEPPALAEPPVKAEPTPEERREFASRLSAAGAATGEITATLLWNGLSDLDLVVRCPSGQQLDYRNPAACGGALDVDANATRDKLGDRPVENAFWPAGRAAPGNYEIAVRYAPRKDEQNPRETPFQVRLIRGGQESVFKGAVRPNAVTPVTTFTVER